MPEKTILLSPALPLSATITAHIKYANDLAEKAEKTNATLLNLIDEIKSINEELIKLKSQQQKSATVVSNEKIRLYTEALNKLEEKAANEEKSITEDKQKASIAYNKAIDHLELQTSMVPETQLPLERVSDLYLLGKCRHLRADLSSIDSKSKEIHLANSAYNLALKIISEQKTPPQTCYLFASIEMFITLAESTSVTDKSSLQNVFFYLTKAHALLEELKQHPKKEYKNNVSTYWKHLNVACTKTISAINKIKKDNKARSTSIARLANIDLLKKSLTLFGFINTISKVTLLRQLDLLIQLIRTYINLGVIEEAVEYAGIFTKLQRKHSNDLLISKNLTDQEKYDNNKNREFIVTFLAKQTPVSKERKPLIEEKQTPAPTERQSRKKLIESSTVEKSKQYFHQWLSCKFQENTSEKKEEFITSLTDTLFSLNPQFDKTGLAQPKSLSFDQLFNVIKTIWQTKRKNLQLAVEQLKATITQTETTLIATEETHTPEYKLEKKPDHELIVLRATAKQLFKESENTAPAIFEEMMIACDNLQGFYTKSEVSARKKKLRAEYKQLADTLHFEYKESFLQMQNIEQCESPEKIKAFIKKVQINENKLNDIYRELNSIKEEFLQKSKQREEKLSSKGIDEKIYRIPYQYCKENKKLTELNKNSIIKENDNTSVTPFGKLNLFSSSQNLLALDHGEHALPPQKIELKTQ